MAVSSYELISLVSRLILNLLRLSFLLYADTRKVYGTIVSAEDHIVSLDGSKFDKINFKKYPEQYRSNFAEEVM